MMSILFALFYIAALPAVLSFLHIPSIPMTRRLHSRRPMLPAVGPSNVDQVHTVETLLNKRIYNMDQSALIESDKQEKCIIVGVDKTLRMAQHATEELSTMESFIEMMELCRTANLRIMGSCVQRMSVPNPKSYLGEGKMNELRELCKLSGAHVVVVDDDISPRQQRCIEQALSKSGVQINQQGEESKDYDEEDTDGDTDGDSSSLITSLRQWSSQRDRDPSKQSKKKVNVQPKADFAPVKVLDRTAIILDIFAQHARSREGQLQVELAMMEYRSTRGPNVASSGNGNSDNTVGDGKGSSGAGLRGPGETKLELDRRKIQTRILLLKEEIAKLQLQRQVQRSGRSRFGAPIVALVGYTNAGKSTILNRLSKAGVLAENLLFATLDPTTRKIRLPARTADGIISSDSTERSIADIDVQDYTPADADVDGDGDGVGTEGGSEGGQGMEILLTDTVGFISKLPSSVVAAFRATLESVADADVLIHVCDRSSPSWEKQRAVVLQELARIAEKCDRHVPIVEFWNKIDALPVEERELIQNELKSVPIEMHIVARASSDLPQHAPVSFAQATSTPDNNTGAAESKASIVEVDDELYMCATLPDNSSNVRKVKKQTKNQKRNKDRIIQVVEPPTVTDAPYKAKVFKVAFDTTVDRPYANAVHQLRTASGAPATPGTDMMLSAEQDQALRAEPAKHLVYTTAGSALSGAGIDSLVARVEDALSLQFISATLHIPFAEDAGITSSIHLRGVVSAVRYDDDGVTVTCRLPAALAESLAKYKVQV